MKIMHKLFQLTYHIGAYERSVDALSKILLQKEAVWMAKKPEFKQIFEYMMTEALRRGVSQHLAEITPCVAYDLQKIITLGHAALGK